MKLKELKNTLVDVQIGDIGGDFNVGDVIHLHFEDGTTQSFSNFQELIENLKNQEETLRQILLIAKNNHWDTAVKQLQNTIKQSDYDGFVADVKAFTHNQQANTSLPIVGKTVDTLQNKSLKLLFDRKRVKEHFRLYKVSAKSDISQKLKTLNLITNGFVLKGTFLCLADIDQIRSVSQNAYISKFFSFEDKEGLRTAITEFVQGNLIEQFEQMLKHIKNNLYLVRDVETRTEDYQIPEQVFTELLANAFIHRSYDADVQTNIKVELYPDRLSIFNPGRFPEGVDLAQTEKIDNSYIINPEIVQIFYLNEWVETAAQGIKRSQALLRSRRMKPAIFQQKEGYVKVTIYKERQTTRQEALEEGYRLIENQEFVGFFEWADNFAASSPLLRKLKNEFINEGLSLNYIERLKVFAQHIVKEATSENGTH
jgi:predicted HTH transcriptional regulator